MKSVDATLARRCVGCSNEGGGLIRLKRKGLNSWYFGGIVPGDFSIDRIDARYHVQGVFVVRFGLRALGCEGELNGIAKELVAAINGAVQNGEFREQGVVEEGCIDVYAIHFIDVEVVGVLGIDHQLVAADIAIVFDDEGVAQRGAEVFSAVGVVMGLPKMISMVAVMPTSVAFL